MKAAKPVKLEPGVPRLKPEVWFEFAELRSRTTSHGADCACGDCRKKLRALGQLCRIHTPLALRFMGRFLAKWSMFGDIPVEDARQAAQIGLMRAVQNNTTEKGKFAAYVWMWIRLELTKCAESFGVRVKKLPLCAADYRRVVDVEIRTGRLAEPEDVPGIPEKKLRDAQFKPHFCEVSEEHAVYDLSMEDLIDRKRLAEALRQ